METLLIVLSAVSTFNIGVIVGMLIGYFNFVRLSK